MVHFSGRNTKRLLIIIPLILLVAAIATQIGFNFYFNKKIKTDLIGSVGDLTRGKYQLEMDELGANIFSQSVSINGFRLTPSKNSDSSEAAYFVSADEINFIDCSLFAFIFRKTLVISKMELKNPVIYLYRNTEKTDRARKEIKKEFSLFSPIEKHVSSLLLKKLSITNASFLVYDSFHDINPVMSCKDNLVEISNFRLSRSIDDADKLFEANKINLSMNRFTYTTRDSLYTFNVKRLNASYSDSTLVIDSIKVIPNFSRKKFSNEAGSQTDRMRIDAGRILFDRMNLKLFFERNRFIAQQLTINNMNVAAYRDKNAKRIEERAKSVQELMKDIPFYAAIGKIKINNANIVYEEVASGKNEAGRVTCNKLFSVITGFTSDSTLFSSYKSLVVRGNARLMNEGRMTAYYKFPLNTNRSVFDCSGTLSKMSFTSVNSILVPTANIRVEKGVVDSMAFSFHSNGDAATGKMHFYYHDLKIKFLRTEDHRRGGLQNALTFLANEILLKENNPSGNKPLRITEINYTRNPNRFIFNYTWKSILSGIKPALGLPKNL